jgi:hypothetical protein
MPAKTDLIYSQIHVTLHQRATNACNTAYMMNHNAADDAMMMASASIRLILVTILLRIGYTLSDCSISLRAMAHRSPADLSLRSALMTSVCERSTLMTPAVPT